MSRGGGKKVEQKPASPEEERRIEELIRAREEEWIMRCLSEAYYSLAEVLENKEKVKKKDTIFSLATKVSSMVDTVCGMCKAYEAKVKEAEGYLQEVAPERDLISMAISARHEIKHLNIVSETLWNRLRCNEK